MVKSLTDSLVSREEEERYQKNLNENEQLKIAEVSVRHKLGYNFNKAILLFSCAFPSIRDIQCFTFFFTS